MLAAATAFAALTLPLPNHGLTPCLKAPGTLTGVSEAITRSLSAVRSRIARSSAAVSVGLADSTRPHTPATVGVALEVPPKSGVKRELGVKSEPAPAPSL